MPVEVILPKVDMDMAAGKISKWHVKDGDAVRKGVLIFEIETDKAAMEIEAPGDGIIRDISAAEGETVPTGSVVAMIYGAGETGTAQRSKRDVETPPARPADAPGPRNGHASTPVAAIRATPLARRLARTSGIDLTAVNGSGPQGRIVADDIRRSTIAPKAEAPTTITGCEPESYEAIPIDAMRRTIAQRLMLAKQTIPHFYLSLTCDLENLQAARTRLNVAAPAKLSLNDFIIKAWALALQKVPDANVTWADDAILKHRSSDIGVAVAVPGGLFTPVIRHAERKTLTDISAEMKDLAERARAKKLSPPEYRGGSTAISNLGMYGIEEFTAIINPPHATILAIGAATQRNAVHQGAAEIRMQMTCTLSGDHRAIDGALGAQLLAAFKRLIEDPILMLA